MTDVRVTFEPPGTYAVQLEGGTMRSSLEGALLFLTDGPAGVEYHRARKLLAAARSAHR